MKIGWTSPVVPILTSLSSLMVGWPPFFSVEGAFFVSSSIGDSDFLLLEFLYLWRQHFCVPQNLCVLEIEAFVI